MDRLSFIKTAKFAGATVLAGLFLLQCQPENVQKAPSRVVSVQQKSQGDNPLPAFCDYLDEHGAAKKVLLPQMDNAHIDKSTAKTKWLVLWATWCKPCIEEMPRIAQWVQTLQKSGAGIDVEFLSVDEDAEALKRFYEKRPGFPPSAHLTSPDALPALIEQSGLDTGAGLPIHIFMDSKNSVRCSRAAAVNPSDYPAVEHLTQL